MPMHDCLATLGRQGATSPRRGERADTIADRQVTLGTTSSNTGERVRARPRGLVAGWVVFVGLLVTSCGSDPTVTEARTAPAPAIGATGVPDVLDSGVAAPAASTFQLQLPDEVVANAVQRAEEDAQRQAERPATRPGTMHRLERQVIDRKPADREPAFDWDQEAALACAHVEFALDALIAQDRPALDRTLRDAADWARDSGATEISDFVAELRRTQDFAEAEVLVFDILGRCAEAGYEL